MIPFLVKLELASKAFTIIVGVATALLATVLLSIINYLHEKKSIINKAYESFSEIYFGLMQIDDEIGKVLVSRNITDKTFGINYTLTQHIINVANSSQIEFYNSFLPLKLSNTMKKFDVYISKLRNLNQLTGERARLVLSHELLLKEIEVNMLNGADEKTLQDMNNQAQDFKETVLISIAKLHEFEVSLKLELDDLLIELDKNFKFNYKWNDKRCYFEKIINKKVVCNGIS